MTENCRADEKETGGGRLWAFRDYNTNSADGQRLERVFNPMERTRRKP